MLKISFLVGLPMLLLAALPADAVSIVTYNLAGTAGNQVSQVPSAVAPNITGLSITRGAGVNPAAGTNSFNSNNFGGNITTPATDPEFVQFGFTVNPGFRVNLNNLLIGTQSSATGPGTVRLFSSADNFTAVLATITQGNGTVVNSNINLAALTNLTGTINFRIVEFGNTQADGTGATGNGGTFRLLNNSGTSNIVFDGTVQAIPFQFSPLLGIAGLSAIFATKKKLQKTK